MERDVIIIAKSNIACFDTHNGKWTGHLTRW